jgi:subtilisin family serine protease
VAICDTGLDTGHAEHLHPDFRSRVIALESYPISAELSPFIFNPGGDDGPADLDSGHGTHVAGSAVGSGAASASLAGLTKPIRGLGHRAKLVFQAVEQEVRWKNPADTLEYGRYLLAGIPDDLTSLFQSAYSKGARIHSNSWGGGDPGEYDSQCWQLDDFVWKHPDFCVLVAAGNDGTDADGDGIINATSVTSPATAKNCITVGATESLRRQFDSQRYGDWWPDDYPVPPFRHAPMANGPAQVVAFSSRGPTLLGRTKPEVVAPGTFVLSTRSRVLSPSQHGWAAFPESGEYFYMGGTSMATPLTAGAVACVREFLREWVGYENPSAALLKAALIGGATRLPNPGTRAPADDDQGYGLVNLDSIVASGVYFYDDVGGLNTGDVDEFSIRVRSSNRPLRVALAYTDFPGPSLVNNLNLILESPTGHLFTSAGSDDGILQLDDTNNTEVVRVASPSVGQWSVRIIGSSVPQGGQEYALMLSGDLG